VEYEDFGNYNYGGTGGYVGVPLIWLKIVSLLGALRDPNESWEDEQQDQYWIEKGYLHAATRD
jgi:hypothetical protein